MAATSSACRSRPIAPSAAAARAAPAWRRARRISSAASSSPIPTRRCCSSPPAAWSTSSRSTGCRSARRRRAARRWSTCCRSRRARRSPTVMPLPEDEASWATLDVMFATASGDVRRNKLSDFVNVKANGKIAMKLEEGDRLIGVAACTEADDVLLATRCGKLHPLRGRRRARLRRPHLDRRARHLARRGRRGDLDVDPAPRRVSTTEERDAYLRLAALAPAGARGAAEEAGGGAARQPAAVSLAEERFDELQRPGGIHPDRHRHRLRQAHLGLRVPHHRPRRQGHRDIEPRAQGRPRRRRLPGRGTATRSCW